MKTWSKWKHAYLAAYARGINSQRAGATDEPFSQAAKLVPLSATYDVMDALARLFDNLALAATTNRTTVQQLTSAKSLTNNVSCNSNGGQQKAHQKGCLLQPRASGTQLWRRMRGQQRPSWPQSNLGQLLLDTWVQGIAYQQNLQCDWQETGVR
jgi:hypothetical protein